MTPDPLSVFSLRLQENAARYFPQFEGHRVAIRCVPVRAGSNRSYRFELRSEKDTRRAAEVVVKFNPPHKPQQIEFEHLRLLFANRTPSLIVPRPLDYFPDLNALLTERVGGEQLSKLLLRRLHLFAGRKQRAWIASRIRLSGQWLANYHRLTRRPSAPPFTEEWLERLVPTIDGLHRIGFPPPVLARVRSVLQQLHERGRHESAPYAERHGDFGLYNVHAGGEWVCAFDFNDRRPECVYDDLSFVGATLETMNQWPRHPFFDRRAAILLKHEFVAGYFGTPDGCSRLLLEGHALKHLLRLCLKQRQRLARRVGAWVVLFDALKLRGFYRRRVLQQCELLDGLLRSSTIF